MKIMASDFDGTLFFRFIGDGKGFKQEDVDAIEAFRKKGHKFGICTGRPLYGIEVQCEDRMPFDFYILSSGSVILDEDKKILYENSLTHETMKRLAQEFSVYSNIWVHAHHKLYAVNNCPEINVEQQIVENYDAIPRDLIHCVSFKMRDEQTTKEICEYINKTYKDVEAFRNDCFIDVVAKGVSKGNAVKIYQALTHADKTYGIGDNYNDITLLNGTDISYTFHHSPEDVKKCATHVVDSVAEAIYQILEGA